MGNGEALETSWGTMNLRNVKLSVAFNKESFLPVSANSGWI